MVPVHEKDDNTDCKNYRGTSLLSTSYNILLNILLSRLCQYIEEILSDHPCRFRRIRSTTAEFVRVQRDSTSAIHRFQEIP
jgi:hypothetical protein